MNAPGQFACMNHPHAQANRVCASCGRPFCENCVVEFMGRDACLWCRDAQLYRVQNQGRTDAKSVVLMARIFDGVMLLFSIGGSVFMAIYFGFISWAVSQDTSPNREEMPGVVMGGFLAACVLGALVSLAAYLPPLLKLGPGRPAYWTWQLVAIILAILGSCASISFLGYITIIPAIVLLVFWLKPEVREYCA